MSAPNIAPRPAEWAARAPELAAFVQEHMVNRDDVWGGYKPMHLRKDGEEKVWTLPAKSERGSVRLSLSVLERHFRGVAVEHVMGLHTTSPANTSRWFVFDIDAHEDNERALPAENWRRTEALTAGLRELAFTPLIEDSNGKGGYHVWVLLDRPAPTADVYHLMQSVLAELGFTCETFPKQASIEPERFGNWVRLPGRHHTHDFYSRFYVEGRWVEGAEAVTAFLSAMISPGELVPSAPEVPSETPRSDRAQAAATRSPEGKLVNKERNNFLTREAGKLRRHGLSPAVIKSALVEINAERCSPPLDEAEIDGIVASASGWVPAALPDNIAERCTDLANAVRFAHQHAEDFRYVPGLGWMYWTGNRWAMDEVGAVVHAGKDTVRRILIEAADVTRDDREKGEVLAKWALASQSAARIRNMVALAESDPVFHLTADKFDADPWKFNVLNGTIDLRTGNLSNHNRADLITMLAPVEFDPAATCPQWDRALNYFMRGDQELLAFVQRAAGYSIAGSAQEQCLLICYGEGSNGKSTTLETISAVAGDYATAMNFSTLTARRDNAPSEDIARLRGKRLVTSIETGQDRTFNEEVVKQLTGGDTVAARFLYKSTFTFRPQFTLWLATNHKPRVQGTDHAIWRRIKLVPFLATIPDEDKDTGFVAKLVSAEAPGVLNWLLKGFAAWQQHGLGGAAAVSEATKKYRADEDVMGAFIQERCEPVPEALEKPQDLYDAYTDWCSQKDREPVSITSFGRRLSQLGYEKVRPGDIWMRKGLRLRQAQI